VAAEPQVSAVAEPQVSVDIAVVVGVSIPVSEVAVVVYSSGRPRSFAFPNIDYYSNSASSVEVVGEESVHSSTGAHTNYGLCNILSNPGLHQNKNLEHGYNNPNLGHNNVSNTKHLPKDATTSHSRKTGLPLYREQRKHNWYQAILSHQEAHQIRSVVVRNLQLHPGHHNQVRHRCSSLGETGTALWLLFLAVAFSS
jgi:hypothetical protein